MMNFLFCFRRISVWSFLLLGLMYSQPVAAQYTNGIYAEFSTSMGSFTCRLEYALAPRTCANFIALATGQRPWLHEPSGLVRTNPAFNGGIFHRVVSNFVIQAGSPTGLPNGGPGYDILDEFTPSLRHDAFGVLSMANNGPDSGGSQFFVTMGAKPGLDDIYSVFGRYYGGSNVIYNINRVATDSNEKPLANVLLNSVLIRRVGAAAIAFNINTNLLPWVTNQNLRVRLQSGTVNLSFSNQLSTEVRLYSSPQLSQWTETKFGINVVNPPLTNIATAPVLSREFFRLAQIQYAQTLFVPKNVLNKTVTLNLANGNGTFVIQFNGSGGGSYTWTGGSSGAVLFYDFRQDPYRGRFLPLVLENFFYNFDLHLDYDSLTAGTLKGMAYPAIGNPVTLSGTFTAP